MKLHLVCLWLAVLPAVGAAATPSITGATLNPIDAGGPEFTLTITGSGFTSGAEVYWGSFVLDTTYISSVEVHAVVLPELRLISDNYYITVHNPEGTVSNAYAINVTPVLGYTTPSAAVAGSGSLNMTVKGIGFQSRFVVKLSLAAGPVTIVPTLLDTGTLAAIIPASALTTPQTASLQIVDPKTGNTSGSRPFEIHSLPAITAASPNPFDAGGLAFPLKLTGTGFPLGAQVNWSGVAVGTTYISPTEVQAAITPDLRTLAGAFPVTVSDPATSAVSNPFTIVISPVLLTLGPASAIVNSPAVTVTVTGAGFTNSTVLAMTQGSQQTALATTYVSATVLTAVIPASAMLTAGSLGLQIVDTVGGGRSLSQAFTVTQQPTPAVASLSPAAISAGAAGFTLTVTGANFLSGAVVLWNGSPLPTTFVSASQLTAPVPAAWVQQAAAVSITVSNSGGNTSAPLAFSVRNPPTISAVSPGTVDAGGGAFVLTVTGTNFAAGSVVTWPGVAPLGTAYVSATQLQATVTSDLRALAGSFKVTVSDPMTGATSNAASVTIAPVLFSVSPASAVAGSPAVTITLSGAGFTANTAVAGFATTYVSATTLTAVIPADSMKTAGTIPLQVVDSSGGGRSLSQTFSVGNLPAPALSGLSPASVAAGAAAFTLTLTGSNFLAGSVALWNGTALTTTVTSSTQLTATVPASLVQQPAAISITVSNAGVTSAALTLSVRGTPAISSASPGTIDAGGPSFLLNVTGTGFAPGTVVNWQGVGPLGTTYISTTQLQATVTADLRTLAGGFKLTVSDPATGATSNSITEIVAPVLFSISPATAMAGSAAVTITATGTGFTANTTLSGLPTTYVSATTLTGVIPAESLRNAGSLAIQVVDSSGGGRSQQQTFTVGHANPSITVLVPNAANAGAAAFTLLVNGANFTSAATVLWNGAALPTTFVSATQLTAAVTAALVATQGAATISVSIAGVASGAATFTINPPPPTLSTIAPASAIAGGPGFTLTAAGTNCGSGCVVQWNGAALTTSSVSGTQVSAFVPASFISNAGKAAVQLVNAAGAASNSLSFVINPPAPTLTSLSPAFLPAGNSSVALTANGANFVSGATVLWNTTALPTTWISTSQLTAIVPANLTAGQLSATVTVSNPGGAASNALTVSIAAPQPTLGALSPASTSAGGASFTITLTGQNFAINCVARWNGTPLYTTFVSSSQATATVPADLIAGPATASITLVNPSGLESNAAAFTVTTPTPSVDSLSPATAPAGSAGITLMVTGSNFLPGSKIIWNATQIATTFVSSTQLKGDVPATLLAAQGLANITINSSGVGSPNAAVFTVGVPVPAVPSAGIVNAASSKPAIAPGSLISIYGTNLAPSDAAAPSLPLPETLNGTSVSINGIPAPLVFVSSGQINAQVPFEVQPGVASLIVTAGALKSAPTSFYVKPTAPGLWPVDSTPVQPGDYLTIYVTGQGLCDRSDPFPAPLAPVTVQVAGQEAQIAFAGMPPALPGILQVNLIVPPASSGAQDLTITIGGVPSNAVPLWIK